ncbi:hypothetical protein L484_016014 [Morus notabilis]|uniref:Uncharacterized protein n=1 Tax=Morus notabilis TaxID=981085 RepID=W9R7E6_9ROSA|nr:hypothetical protein L484_016014 [Morus notabilis]
MCGQAAHNVCPPSPKIIGLWAGPPPEVTRLESPNTLYQLLLLPPPPSPEKTMQLRAHDEDDVVGGENRLDITEKSRQHETKSCDSPAFPGANP